MQEHIVGKAEAGLRLDKWMKQRLPGLPFGLSQKLLRKGAIKLNGKKAKADARVEPGDVVRVPELENATQSRKPEARAPRAEEAKILLDNIVYQDADIIAINKPQGLATQGGSGIRVSVDALLDHVRFGEAERPKLVHRIDKDTSGVLLLARRREVAAKLMEGFKTKRIRKIYYALVVGVPELKEGRIDVRLAAKQSFGGPLQKAAVDEEHGQVAVTLYQVIDHAAGKKLAFVALMPLTGRMHQLRVHMAHIGHPILGDGKYGGKAAFIEGLGDTMHLHARRVILEDGTDIEAPFAPHIMETLKLFEFTHQRKELRRLEKEMLEELA